MIEYSAALHIAPFAVLLNSQFFRPTANGRIAFSARLLSIGKLPSSRNVYRYGFSCRGVADGDIRPDTTDEDLEYYIEDDAFADLMDTFLHIMKKLLVLIPFSAHHCGTVSPLACCASSCSAHSRRRTSCFTAVIAVVVSDCIPIPPRVSLKHSKLVQ